MLLCNAYGTIGFLFISACTKLHSGHWHLKSLICHRRSAVSRQACHLVSVLAENMGTRLEPLAMAFLPALFKVVVITVQVSYHALMLHGLMP